MASAFARFRMLFPWKGEDFNHGGRRRADTPHGLQPDGFLVQRPRQRRDSPQALSKPENGSGRVLVAVGHIPAPRWVRTASAWEMRSPQSVPSASTVAHSCDVDAGAPAAVSARIQRRWRHPASCMLVLRPTLRLAPVVCRGAVLVLLGGRTAAQG